jgi:hypothetical protein
MARRKRSATRREALSVEAEAWLHNEPCGFFKFHGDDVLKALWRDHGDRIVEEHVEQFPGTRPEHWWSYSAPRSPRGTYPGRFYDGKLPEPRERLGGTGTPDYEARAVVPSFSFGVPDGWIDIDRDDMPLFESEATYLKRHGLLFPGEAKRLMKEDWEPEPVAEARA